MKITGIGITGLVCMAGLALDGVAATPLQVGQLSAPARIISMSTVAEGKRAVLQLQDEGKLSGSLQLVDTTDITKPGLLGAVAIERNGSLVLSPDGKFALLAVPGVQDRYDVTIKRDLFAFDLADPQTPRQLWKKTFDAGRMSIAPDASAFAVSRPNAEGVGHWLTTVTWVRDNKAEVMVQEEKYGYPTSFLSRGGAFLVFFGGDISVYDLRSSRPILYQQKYGGFQRHKCLVALLDDGRIVVEDERTSRFGIYQPKPDVPRVATLAHEKAEYCTRMDLNAGDASLLLHDRDGGLRRLDLTQSERPLHQGTWHLPPITYPLAASGSAVYAVAGNARDLLVFRLDAQTEKTLDWIALQAAHRSILEDYGNNMKKRGPIPWFDAYRRLEDAGVFLALDAPLGGFPPNRAAVILNDYGFLSGKDADKAESAQKFLRRAIALDSKRSVAYLNLADLLRQNLSRQDDWTKKEEQIREIQKNYRKYLALGGKKTAAITAFLNDPSAQKTPADTCSTVASLANSGRLGEFVSAIGIGVRTRDRKIDIVFTTEGTAHVPGFYAFDSATDFPIEEDAALAMPPGSDELWGGDVLGLYVDRNGGHILHYRDFGHPVASISLADGKTCGFNASTKEMIGAKALEPELCKKLQSGEGPTPFAFDGPTWMSGDDVRQRYGETGIVGTRLLDVANDGKPVNVALFQLTSGAGAGCDEYFFDAVDRNAAHFESSPKRELLMQLQGTMNNRYPILPCFNKPAFFAYKGKIYFETKPATWPPVDAWNQYHRVTRIDGEKVVDVCEFRFETKVTGY